MNLGRLLEVGAPQRPVRAPGHALRRHLPGRRQPAAGAAGRRWHPLRRDAGGCHRAHARPCTGREHEVVTVLRPEEVETRGRARAALLQLHRAAPRWRKCSSPARSNGCACACWTTSAPCRPRREWRRWAASRSRAPQPERARCRWQVGAEVALGARRLHVLPTPLSSFLACAPPMKPTAQAWRRRRCSRPLADAHEDPRGRLRAMPRTARRMRRRRAWRSSSGGAGAALRAVQLLRAGANEVLVLLAQPRRCRNRSAFTGSTMPRVTPRWRSPPACCATCRPRPCAWPSCPTAVAMPAAPTRCARCSMRGPRRAPRMALEMRTELVPRRRSRGRARIPGRAVGAAAGAGHRPTSRTAEPTLAALLARRTRHARARGVSRGTAAARREAAR